MSIKEIECDIFKAPIDVLCHSTNCQCNFGSGLALQVKHKFPEVWEDDRNTIKGDRNKLGKVGYVKLKNPTSRIKYVCNLYTQFNYGTESRQTDYEALYCCLQEVRDGFQYCIKDSQNYVIGIPYQLASFRGGADWRIVRTMIDCIFSGTNDVLICKI